MVEMLQIDGKSPKGGFSTLFPLFPPFIPPFLPPGTFRLSVHFPQFGASPQHFAQFCNMLENKSHPFWWNSTLLGGILADTIPPKRWNSHHCGILQCMIYIGARGMLAARTRDANFLREGGVWLDRSVLCPSVRPSSFEPTFSREIQDSRGKFNFVFIIGDR